MRRYLGTLIVALCLAAPAAAQDATPTPDPWPGGDAICGLDAPCEAEPEDYIVVEEPDEEGYIPDTPGADDEYTTGEVVTEQNETAPVIRHVLKWREA